jgi:hypothetical protein
MTMLTLIDSRQAPAARCLVCGNDIPAGEGVAARYGDRMLRFKCPGCYARFEADPEPYLAGETGGCCGEGLDGSTESDPRRDSSART